MEKTPQKPRWNRFTVSRLFCSTFWAALGLGLYSLQGAPTSIKQPIESTPVLFIAVISATYLSPFIAVGALFGHTMRGLAVGLLVIGGVVIASYIAINNGWIGFP